MAALELLKSLRSYEKTAALFVNGALEAPRPFPELWARIWNGAPVRFCVDGGANRLHWECRREILKTPTVVAGDLDSISEEARAYFAERTKIVHTHDQNETDLTKTLRLVAQDERIANKEIEFVVLLGGFSGRFDHTLASLNSMLVANGLFTVPLIAVDGANLITVLAEGDYTLLINRKDTTGVCGFVPFCQRTATVTTTGFRWDLEEREMAFGRLISTSNEVLAESVRIRTTAPLVFTIELRVS
ncbi:hypothetical protein QR680_013354 [Steinernema hermaphroditum]|uniref:Thiamin pyrophosphokinase thiamin-binding domain-containing protein n=1 Tax=Steinernema hermaphroditum TaxID=289476 RepID=A0AA39I7V0_9BILA|nr:hypothetical protein QR680_013354 [Steinernema hermaphroditum]